MKVISLLKDVKNELKFVEKELQKAVEAPDPLLSETSAHLLNAGGKRLRPAFAILAGKAYNFEREKLLPIAVALELIHMASLVHDDVIDASPTRRGIPTVKARWGNQISMHTGDYLFAKALILISQYSNPMISSVLSDVSVKMCEGEIQQIISSFDVRQGVKDYFYRIKRKTALLISASCQCGALAVDAPMEVVKALGLYGHHLGMAFQIGDDILDLVADQKKLGKPVGGDLRQGIITLPIIYALARSPQRQRLQELVGKREKSEGEVLEAIKIIKESGAVEYSLNMSNRYIVKAKKQLVHLPPARAKDSLVVVADYINNRKY
ncbi:MAG: polyprenyl synthetase family protein [Clostridia bacterium]|nr:polyprenyl synthetase family protein [Clostridia bacterium]